MSKKIKVIELLNKIANGEEVPKKIEYKNMNYKFATHPITGEKWYWRDNVDYWSGLCIDRNILNYNEIKIIEEEPEIDIQQIEQLNAYKLMEAPFMADKLKEMNYDTFMEHLKQSEVERVNKINELIDNINDINKKQIQ